MTRTSNASGHRLPLTALDLQILLVLAQGDLYGYAIMKALEAQSEGILAPGIGSLYRVLGRLMDLGWVEETDASPGKEGESHRGKPRRYYGLTDLGRGVAADEIRRLGKVVRQAEALGPALGS